MVLGGGRLLSSLWLLRKGGGNLPPFTSWLAISVCWTIAPATLYADSQMSGCLLLKYLGGRRKVWRMSFSRRQFFVFTHWISDPASECCSLYSYPALSALKVCIDIGHMYIHLWLNYQSNWWKDRECQQVKAENSCKCCKCESAVQSLPVYIYTFDYLRRSIRKYLP